MDLENVERDINDLVLKMDDLKSTLDAIEGVLYSEHTDAIRGVINEWDNYTKPIMEEMLTALTT